MTTKLVRDLVPGDKVTLDNGVGTITMCEKSGLFETKPKLGGAYQIEWVDNLGETGRAIQSAVDEVEMNETERAVGLSAQLPWMA